VVEHTKQDDEAFSAIIVDSRTVPHAWRTTPHPEAARCMAEWGELQHDKAITVG